MMQSKKVVFILCSGLGWGNCSRQAAVIEELKRKCVNVEIHIITWGKGILFFKSLMLPSNCHLVELKPYSVSGKSYITRLLKSFLCLHTYFFNLLFLINYQKAKSPDVVIFDSDYSYFAFLKKSILRISVNQAADVVRKSKALSWSEIFKKRLLVSYFIERMDLFIQRVFSHFILVPSLSFQSDSLLNPKIMAIPLIVRTSFKGIASTGSQGPAVILSGSGLHKKVLSEFAQRKKIPLFAPTPEAQTSILNGEDIKDFSPIVAQGGLSTLSELLALGCYIYVHPIPHHLEQYLNARQIAKLGLGTYFEAEKNLSAKSPQRSLDESHFNGAEQVVSFILERG